MQASKLYLFCYICKTSVKINVFKRRIRIYISIYTAAIITAAAITNDDYFAFNYFEFIKRLRLRYYENVLIWLFIALISVRISIII